MSVDLIDEIGVTGDCFTGWSLFAQMTADRRSAFLTQSGEGCITGSQSLSDAADFELPANRLALFPEPANFFSVAARQCFAERSDLR